MNKLEVKVNYEEIFNSLQGNYLLMLPDFTIVAANDSYLKTTKTIRLEILGRKLLEVFPDDPNDHDKKVTTKLIATLKKVVKDKKPISMEMFKFNIPKPKNQGGGFEVRYWMPKYSPVIENGEVKYILHNIFDVTEKYLADIAFLQQVEEIKNMNSELNKFKLAVDNSFDKITFSDPNGIVVYANKSTQAITGYTNEESIGKKARDMWGKGMPNSFYENLSSALKSENKFFVSEVQSRKKNGESYIGLINIFPILSEDDKILFYVGVERDITKEKEAVSLLELEKNKAERLIAELNKFKLSVDNAYDKIVFTDPKGIIVYANNATEKTTGYSNEETIGKTAKELWARAMPESSYQNIWDTLKKEKKSVINEVQLKKKNGEIYTTLANVSCILGEDGEILFYVSVQRDITKEKEIDKAKTELVSLASHQLLTPLSIVSWYSEMLLAGDAGDLNKEQRGFLEEIYTGNQRTIDLVNSLLNVSKMELGTFVIKPELTSMTELVLDVLKEESLQMKAKKINFTLDLKKDIPDILVDRKYIRMVVQNLLSNAIKYTQVEGSVTLRLRQDKERKKIIMEVADTGIGIPENQQGKIFSKHFRAQNVQEKDDTQGTGLGLYLAKSIIDHSGGLIWFESKLNVGTTFFVELPE